MQTFKGEPFLETILERLQYVKFCQNVKHFSKEGAPSNFHISKTKIAINLKF